MKDDPFLRNGDGSKEMLASKSSRKSDDEGRREMENKLKKMNARQNIMKSKQNAMDAKLKKL